MVRFGYILKEDPEVSDGFHAGWEGAEEAEMAWGWGLSTGRVEMLSIALCCQRVNAAGERGGAQEQKTGLGLGSEVGDIISRKE